MICIAAGVSWYTDVEINGNTIVFHIPDEFVSTSSSGDLVIAYRHMFYTTWGGLALLVSILIVMVLAVVNGAVLLWRRKRTSENARAETELARSR